MVGVGGQGVLDGGAPVVERFGRGAVDQVEADRGEAGLAGPAHGVQGAARGVGALQHPQHVRRRGLHAEGDAGEPGLDEGSQRGGRHRVGVGLGRHLGVRVEAEVLAEPGQDPALFRRFEQGWRAPAEEDRGERGWVAQHAAGQRDLPGHRLEVGLPGRPRRGPELGRGVGVEVAVAAAGRAEGHVHVRRQPPRSDLGEGGRRQRPVVGGGFALGQRGRSHASTVGESVGRVCAGGRPAAGQRSGLSSPARPPGVVRPAALRGAADAATSGSRPAHQGARGPGPPRPPRAAGTAAAARRGRGGRNTHLWAGARSCATAGP